LTVMISHIRLVIERSGLLISRDAMQGSQSA